MYDNKQEFIRDHLSGLDAAALAEKHGITLQAVTARLMWASRHGDIEAMRQELAGVQTEAIDPPDGDEKMACAGLDPVPEARTDMGQEGEKLDQGRLKTPEEIRQMFGTLQDRHNIARLRQSANFKIAAHEKRIGRKDPGFRMAQEMWTRQERCRLLGLTFNDLRRMRGVAV